MTAWLDAAQHQRRHDRAESTLRRLPEVLAEIDLLLGAPVPEWRPHRGCQPAGLEAVRETGLQVARALAFLALSIQHQVIEKRFGCADSIKWDSVERDALGKKQLLDGAQG